MTIDPSYCINLFGVGNEMSDEGKLVVNISELGRGDPKSSTHQLILSLWWIWTNYSGPTKLVRKGWKQSFTGIIAEVKESGIYRPNCLFGK